VRPGSLLATGGCDDRPDYDYSRGVTLLVYELDEGQSAACRLFDLKGEPAATITATRNGRQVIFAVEGTLTNAIVEVAGGPSAPVPDGAETVALSL